MKRKPDPMADHQTAAAGPQTLLDLCHSLLGLRDFATARKYALLAQHSHPTQPKFPQIVAVADVLLAAEKPLPENRPDWFSILQLENPPENQSLPAIRTQFKKLVLLLNPSKNDLPFCRDAFKLVCNAWAVLSDPEKRTQFENEVKNNFETERRELGVDSDGKNGKVTFWTVCSYCYYLYEYEGVYEECCLRCQNCDRAFQGVAVPPPQKGMLVEGKDEYYCGFACFPMEYHLGPNLGEGKRKSDAVDFLGEKKAKNGGFDHENVVEISEDSESSSKGVVKEDPKNGEAEAVMQRGSNGLRVKKSVARNTTKLMGRGMRIELMMDATEAQSEDRSLAEWGDEDDEYFNDLEFCVGEDELFA